MSDERDRIPDSEKQLIADRLGMSTRTVKRALADSPEVSPETRDKVVAERKRLGYGVQPAATIGLIVPDFRNPFFVDLAMSIEQRLAQRNIQLITPIVNAYEEQELANLQRLISMHVSGVFYAQNPPYAGSLAALAGAVGVATVLVDVELDATDALAHAGGLQADAVIVDNEAGIDRAVSHLVIEHGHTDIAFLAGPDDRTTARVRRAAFERSMARHSLEAGDGRILRGDYTFDSGRSAANQLELLRRLHGAMPSAVVCANDLMALGLIKGLTTIGIGVPDPVSVVGFDNIAFATMWTPELTSIDQRVDEIAEAAVRLMSSRIGELPGLTRFEPPDAQRLLRVMPSLEERKTVAHITRAKQP